MDLLRSVDSPTICNVVELFDVQPRTTGYMDQRITACFPKMKPMVGYAVTATFRSATPPEKGRDVYSGMRKQIELFGQVPPPPVVVFQDLDEPSRGATFGEVMCTVYKAFGAAGIVTSGMARDLDQIEAIGLPAFAGGVNVSHAYCQIVDVNLPVTLGGATVHPGDLLHGDRNGVAIIPLAIAGQVARACKAFMETENVLFRYLRAAETPTLAGFEAEHAKSKAMLAELVKQIKSR
jgi:regulator of RNase E activity RraA